MDSFIPEAKTNIDFSLYDALQVAFGKVIFIIRKSFEEVFKANFNKKLARKIEIEYVFHELNTVPKKYIHPESVKPWRTGHALLITKEVIKENFAVINADDFYSRHTSNAIAKQLIHTDQNSYDFSMLAYSLKNTLSANRSVSKGGNCL
jgi:UTP-glucose-1-phosphate uridylyltransferase